MLDPRTFVLRAFSQANIIHVQSNFNGSNIFETMGIYSRHGNFEPITKTRLYNVDPLKPHFNIVKLGFTGVYIIFLISAQNIDCGYSLEPPRHRLAEAVLTSTHNLCLSRNMKKYQSFLYENFQFLEVKFSIYLYRRVFVMP